MAIFKDYFFHGLIRKYTIVMGSLLNDIQVVRNSSTQQELSRVTVPLSYAKKEKWVQRIMDEKEDLTRKTAITLPRMAFEMTNMSYDANRKLSSKQYFAFLNPDSKNTKLQIMMPVPWNFNFSVYIISKTQADMQQIVEQILPMFTPDYTVDLAGIKNPNLNYDIPISLLSVESSDNAEGGFEDRRMIIWTMNFVMRGYLFGPVREKNIIKTVDVKILDYDQLSVAPISRQYLVDVGVVPHIDGVALDDIGADDPWTIEATFTDGP